jgi:hypothetical protein
LKMNLMKDSVPDDCLYSLPGIFQNMSILKKLKEFLGISRKDKPSDEFTEITIERDDEEPITFNGRLVTEHKVENEKFDLTLKLYLMEGMKVMFESKYIDASQSVHKALEFETIEAAGMHLKQIHDELKLVNAEITGRFQ